MNLDLISEVINPRYYLPVSTAVVSYMVILFIKNIGLERLMKIALLTSMKADDIVVEALYKTKQVFIMALAIYIGFHSSPDFREYEIIVDRIFVIILMFQLWVWGREAIYRWIYYTVEKNNRDPSVKTTIYFIGVILRLVLIAVLILWTLSSFGHDVSTIIAGLGIGGVAIALATKSLLEDLFSSLSIVLDKPFLVGDYISIGEWEGVVEYIGLKTTQIRSINGELILVSNSQMLASKIRNYKRLKQRRVSFKLEILTEGTSMTEIIDTVKLSLSSFKNVKFERLNLVSFTAQASTFEVVYWVESSKYKAYTQIHHDVLLKLKHDLDDQSLKSSASVRV